MASLKNIIQDKNGKVGIGTYTPTAKLSVEVAGTADVIKFTRDAGANGEMTFDFSSANSNFYSAQGGFTFSGSSNIRGVNFTADGKVGIGTTAPGAKLTVSGLATGLYTNLLLSNTNDTDGDATGIGFSMLDDMTYVKGGIFYERTDSGGRGSIHIATTNTTDSTSVGLSDARLTVDKDGNVGIGTSSPTRKLHVVGNVKFDGSRDIDFDTTDGNIKITPNSGTWATGYFFNGSAGTYRGGFGALGSIDAITYYWIGDGYNDTTMVIQPNAGNVGIGTTSPTQKLDVNGDIALKGTSVFNLDSPALTIGDIAGTDSVTSLKLTTAGDSTTVYLDDGGNVGIGTTSPESALQVVGTIPVTPTSDGVHIGQFNNYSIIQMVGASGSYIDFSAAGDDRDGRILYQNNINSMQFQTDAIPRMAIVDGNVGIGLTNPSYTLDVNGIALIRNQVRAPIYYDSNNLSYFTRPGDASWSGKLRGVLNIENGISSSISTTDGLRITSPGGGTLSLEGNVTGAIKISLPFYRAGYMVNMTIEVYDYANFESFTVKCGGFAAGSFTNTYANIISTGLVDRNFPVRFGHDGVKSCIWIGNTNSPWSFLKVYIKDVQVGHNNSQNQFIQWAKDWGVSLVNSFDTINTQIFNTQTTNWVKGGTSVWLGSQSSRVGIGNTNPGCRLNTNINIYNTILIRGTNANGQAVGVDGTANLGATHLSTAMGSGTTAGLVLANNVNTVDAPSPLIVFSARSASNGNNTTYAAIYGVNKGQTTLGSNWNKGCIVLATADTDKVEERMRIDENGNVGIGTDNPQYKLTVSSGTDDIGILTASSDSGSYVGFLDNATSVIPKIGAVGNKLILDASQYVGIKRTDPSYALDVNGTIRATGDVIAYSDARVKENVETIPNALDKVKAMRGVGYNKIGEEKRSIGVIAQEMLEVMPEVVSQDEQGMYSVAYGNLVGVLIEAMKEQQQQIDELKAQLNGITS